MTPGARLQAVIELLDEIHKGTAPADRAIAAFFRSRRYVGAKDRRSVMDLAYSVMRSQARLDWWIERSKTKLPHRERARLIAHLALIDGWDADRIAGSFDGGQYRPDQLSEDERRLARNLAGRRLEHADQPANVRLEIPAWIEPLLAARFGPELRRELAATLVAAATDLRVNLLKASVEDAIAVLAGEGIEARRTPLSPVGLRVTGRPPLATLSSFRNGLVEVQDEGSQIVAFLVDARPGHRVVDFCAGAGGKTLAMAAGMANKGRIIACDVLEGRVERASTRLTRAGVHNVERRALSSERDPWVKRHSGTFDRVLVDAPCTGIGTWRRNPDARWRLKPEDISELVALQRRILESAERLVRPGGRLIYATCSMLGAENEEQIAWFLKEYKDYRLLPIADLWAETIGGACPASGDFLNLTPAGHGTDGFFAAILEKSAARAFSIRPAGADDARTIAEIHFAGWNRAYGEIVAPELVEAKRPEKRVATWQQWIDDKERTTLVGIDGEGRIQGFVCGGPVLDHHFTRGDLKGFDCEIYNLHTRAEIEGKGLGRSLISAFARARRKRGARSLMLWAYRDNRFRSFYDRLEGVVVAEGLDEVVPDVAYGWSDIGNLIKQCEAVAKQPGKDRGCT